MTVEDANEKIKRVRRIIGLFNDRAIEFNIAKPLMKPLYPSDIIDVLEEYIYLLNHLKVSEQVINYKIYKEGEV